MRSLVKVMLILAAIFASTFVIGRVLGILTEDNVRMWLTQASETSPVWIAAIVIGLLFIDLLVAVPTGVAHLDFAAWWREDNDNPALARFLKLVDERYPLAAGT